METPSGGLHAGDWSTERKPSWRGNLSVGEGGGTGEGGSGDKANSFQAWVQMRFPPGEMAGVSEAFSTFSVLYLSGTKAISHFHPFSKRGPGTPR